MDADTLSEPDERDVEEDFDGETPLEIAKFKNHYQLHQMMQVRQAHYHDTALWAAVPSYRPCVAYQSPAGGDGGFTDAGGNAGACCFCFYIRT